MTDAVDSLGHLVVSPVRFFRGRLQHPPNWMLACTPVVVYTGLVTATAFVVARKRRRALAPVLASLGVLDRMPADIGVLIGTVSMAAATLTGVGMSASAVVTLDLLVSQSGRARRLVELIGLSYITQIPWAAVALAVSTWWWDPAPLRLPSGVTVAELSSIVPDYQEALERSPAQATLRLVGAYFGLWLVALQAVSLRVVSGFGTTSAWAAGVGLAAGFVGVPHLLR